MIRASHKQPGYLAALLHRLSGIALAIFLPLHFYALGLALDSADTFATFFQATNTPLDYVLDEEINNDLLIFQVDLFSARGPLPVSLLEAAEREKDIRFSSRTRMNTDKNKQVHNARRALRELMGKLPDYLRNDPSVEILCKAAKENTVTMVHLIYRSKNYESNSKDYDFSHIGMVEHWGAGERDVHLSMRHRDWLERPQSGETMVTYDLTGDGTETLDGKQE